MRISMTYRDINIKKFAPILADQFIGYKATLDSLRDFQTFIDSKKEALGELFKYLNNQMSDFEIISASLNDNILDIEINDTSYWISKDEISSDIDLYNEVFPFHLIYKNVHEYSVNEVLNDGTILNNHDFDIIGAEIMCDQLIDFDESKIVLGLKLWKYTDSLSKNALLIISADSFDVIDNQTDKYLEIKKDCL